MHDDNDQDEEMLSGLRVAERDLLRSELLQLPDAPPPRRVWDRIAEQAEAEGLISQPRTSRRHWQWYAGAGLAAAVLLVMLRLPMPANGPGSTESFPTEPAYVDNSASNDLAALMVQSRILEQDLRALPAKPSMMRAGTAATIDDLEDRIAAIDHVLNNPDAGLSEDDTKTFWRERVRLMELLVQLRYAQARRNSL